MPKVSPAAQKDAQTLAQIAAGQKRAAHWTEGDFLTSLRAQTPSVFKITDDEGKEILGFICYSGGGDYRELVNFAIRAGHAGKGIGKQLLRQSLDELQKQGARDVSLEVASPNDAAICLYKRFGFTQAGSRRAFYDGKEDALIMGIKL